jgi:hypothetical protein
MITFLVQSERFRWSFIFQIEITMVSGFKQLDETGAPFTIRRYRRVVRSRLPLDNFDARDLDIDIVVQLWPSTSSPPFNLRPLAGDFAR